MKHTLELEGYVAFVTGAAGTMGIASTIGLLEKGAKVVMADIHRENLEKAISTIAKQTNMGHRFSFVEENGKIMGDPSDDILAVVFDASDREASFKAVEIAAKYFGTIDILVNNAGILSKHKAVETTEEEWHKVFSVNLDSAFFLSQAVLPLMRKKRWGRIINTCSFAAKSGGITAGTAYSVSKAAMVGLTFSLAAETTKDGITVNGIAPAYVKTPMVTEKLNKEEQLAVMDKIPVGRYCEPEEFAHVVTFLASPLAGFITGEIVDQNGGLQFD